MRPHMWCVALDEWNRAQGPARLFSVFSAQFSIFSPTILLFLYLRCLFKRDHSASVLSPESSVINTLESTGEGSWRDQANLTVMAPSLRLGLFGASKPVCRHRLGLLHVRRNRVWNIICCPSAGKSSANARFRYLLLLKLRTLLWAILLRAEKIVALEDWMLAWL